MSIDEYYGSAAEGLCKAAIGYDKDKNYRFSTFAYKCMENEIWKTFRYEKAKKRKGQVISLSSNIESGKEYLKSFVAKENVEENYMFYASLLMALNITCERKKEILKKLFEGKTQKCISNEMKLSERTISREIKKIRELLSIELLNL